MGSGSQADTRFDELHDLLLKKGFQINKTWRIGEELGFATALQELKNSTTELAVVAGGDGTLSGVTGALVGTNKTMAVIPSGTFNYFARNLNIPETMPEAVENLINGKEAFIPIGKVNDRYFLNNASFGLYPTALKKREAHYKRWGRGRLIAVVSLISTLLGQNKIYRTTMHTDDTEQCFITPFVFVGVNEFQLESIGLRGKRCLDHSKLAIYITDTLRLSQRLWVTFKAIFHKLEQANEYHVTCASSLKVELRKDHVRVAIDGEVHRMESPLELSLQTKALKVVLPLIHEGTPNA